MRVLIALLLLVVSEPLGAQPLACRSGAADLTWRSLAPERDRTDLDRWCDSVGPPLLISPSRAVTEPLATLVIASWNVHVGNGDLDRFLDWLARAPEVPRPYGVVLLLQEAVRVSGVVPVVSDRIRSPRALRARSAAQEIGAVAVRRSMHLAYVPSMRNGRGAPAETPQDRGNAILSTLPLLDVEAIELPFGKQRHVAIAASIDVTGRPRARVLAVHLDPSSHRAEEAGALAAAAHAISRGLPLVVGGDLNTWFGRDEPAFTSLARAVSEERCGREPTNTWPWRLQAPLGWWRGRLDYIFSTLSEDVARRCETVRELFGSDHRPVVMTVEPLR